MATEYKYDVFISYRHDKGDSWAEALQAKLEQKGCLVFKDTKDLEAGNVDKELDKVIPEYSNFILIISKDCFPSREKDTDLYII